MTGLDPETIARVNLRRVRLALGISQQQIAERLAKGASAVRLAQTQIAKIERGERPWRLNELVAIADALGVGMDELLRADAATSDRLLVAAQEHRQAAGLEQEARQRWEEAKALLDRAAKTLEDLTAEENKS